MNDKLFQIPAVILFIIFYFLHFCWRLQRVSKKNSPNQNGGGVLNFQCNTENWMLSVQLMPNDLLRDPFMLGYVIIARNLVFHAKKLDFRAI